MHNLLGGQGHTYFLKAFGSFGPGFAFIAQERKGYRVRNSGIYK